MSSRTKLKRSDFFPMAAFDASTLANEAIRRLIIELLACYPFDVIIFALLSALTLSIKRLIGWLVC